MRNIHVANWPRSELNAYIRLYYQALEKHGIFKTVELVVNDAELKDQAIGLDALHFQWSVDQLWRRDGLGWWTRLRAIAGLWRFLRLAHRLRLEVLWTVHDLLEQEPGYGFVDHLGFWTLARAADLCICHDEETRQRLLRRFGVPAGKTIVMALGNYDGVFPVPHPRGETLARYGLDPHRRTLLCQGMIFDYKRFDLAIAAMPLLGSEYQLVVAGLPADRPTAQHLMALAAGATNVRLILERVSEGDVADLHEAADAVLLPYRRVTGSGALLTSLSQNRGVVTSNLPFFTRLLELEPDAGVIMAETTAAGVADAVRRYFALPIADRHAAARRLANRRTWDQCVEPVVAWYTQVFRSQSATRADGN